MNRLRAGSRIPSRRVLGLLPERVLTFLWGVGTHAGARAAMAEGGFTQADHREGAALLARVYAFGSGGVDPAVDEPTRQAEATLADWVRAHFPRLQATLGRLHPEQQVLFQGIEAPEPQRASFALATLLERIERLPPDAETVRDTFEHRDFGVRKREELAQLLRLAQSGTPTDEGLTRDPREAELVELYRWHTEWAATARAYIQRKDFLIVLGLAGRTRKRGDSLEHDDGDDDDDDDDDGAEERNE